MTSTRPIDMGQVFALTCVRCISNRFSGWTIVPWNNTSVVLAEKANADCHFEWGDPLETKDSFLTDQPWNVTFDGGNPKTLTFISLHKTDGIPRLYSNFVSNDSHEGTWDRLEYNEKRPLLNVENGLYFNGSTAKGAFLSKEPMAWTFESISDTARDFASVVLVIPSWGGAHLKFSDENTFTADAPDGTKMEGKRGGPAAPPSVMKISITHSGPDPWELNKVVALDDSGSLVETSFGDSRVKYPQGAEVIVTPVSGSTVKKLAFSTQDAKEVIIDVTWADNAGGTFHTTHPTQVVHWSNRPRNGGAWQWNDNWDHTHWSYTFVDLENLETTHASSWSNIISNW